MSEHSDSLKSLHTTLIDSRNGYEEALKDAEGRGLTGLFQQMVALRQAAAIELEGFLRSAGEEPSEDGSFLSTVHRTVISIQSLFGDLDERILPGLIDGEKRIVGYYDEAIKLASGTEHSVLTEQRAAVLAKISDMQVLEKKAA